MVNAQSLCIKALRASNRPIYSARATYQSLAGLTGRESVAHDGVNGKLFHRLSDTFGVAATDYGTRKPAIIVLCVLREEKDG